MKRNERFFYDVIEEKDARGIMGGFGIVVGLGNQMLGNQIEVRAVGQGSRARHRVRGYQAAQAIFEAACLQREKTRKAKVKITNRKGEVVARGNVRIPR